jgi:hypothetical protein
MLVFYAGWAFFLLATLWVATKFGLLLGSVVFALWFAFEIFYASFTPLQVVAKRT